MVKLNMQEQLINIPTVNRIIAERIGGRRNIPRVHYNPITLSAIIDLKANRHVCFDYNNLTELKRIFQCDDIQINSPSRCTMKITFIYNDEDETDG